MFFLLSLSVSIMCQLLPIIKWDCILFSSSRFPPTTYIRSLLYYVPTTLVPLTFFLLMNSQSISWFSFLHLLFTIEFLVLFQAPNGSSNLDQLYQICGNTFSCGNTITGIGYPFRGLDDPPYCGHPSFVLTCDDQNNVTNIDIMSTKYRVLEIDQNTQIMRIAREDVMEETCPTEMVNTTLDYSIFDYDASCKNFTFLYGCPGFIPGLSYISCGKNHGAYVFPGTLGPGICNASVIVPGPVTGNEAVGPLNTTELDQALQQGFQIRWKIDSKTCNDCTSSKGRCGYNYAANQTACFCPDPPYISDACAMANETSPTPSKTSSRKGTYSDF